MRGGDGASTNVPIAPRDESDGRVSFEDNRVFLLHPFSYLEGRRLITGGRDGRIHIWNFNNGHCLKTLEKETNNDEITAVTYVEMNRNRCLSAFAMT